MALELPGGLFSQEDVRETPVSTAEANAFSFDTDDFTDTLGAISLKNKTSYWSCSGMSFISAQPDTDAMDYTNQTGVAVDGGAGLNMMANVNLPNGVIVTSVIVYGSAAFSSNWTMERINLAAGTGAEMATAAANNSDSSITGGTIDNNTYAYLLNIDDVGNGKGIYGARITYTTDYN